jgi:hypothetical protein
MATTVKEWMDHLPFTLMRDRRDRAVTLDLRMRVHPGGLTCLAYRRPGAPAESEQESNDYAELEHVIRQVWERARRQVETAMPRDV